MFPEKIIISISRAKNRQEYFINIEEKREKTWNRITVSVVDNEILSFVIANRIADSIKCNVEKLYND